MIRIPQIILKALELHAREDAPLEACGYLAGDGEEVKARYHMTNADKSPEHFSFVPEEQFSMVREARKKGLKLLAVYHSHPASPARLSEEDIRLAQDPDTIYVIHSLLDNLTKAFKIKNGKINEEMIEVI